MKSLEEMIVEHGGKVRLSRKDKSGKQNVTLMSYKEFVDYLLQENKGCIYLDSGKILFIKGEKQGQGYLQ